MDNPGSFSLGDFTLSAAGQQAGTPVADLAGVASLGLFARFAFGAAATGVGNPLVEAYIQTSFDQGQTFVDICCFAFQAASGVQVANVATGSVVAPMVPQMMALADNTVVSGLLGDQVQAIVKVTGGYANATLLSLWGVAR